MCVFSLRTRRSGCKEEGVEPPQEPFQPPQTAEELKNMLQGEWVNISRYEADDRYGAVADSVIYIAIFYGDSVKGILNLPKFYEVSSPERIEMKKFTISYKAITKDTLETPRWDNHDYISPATFPTYSKVSFHSADSITITKFWISEPIKGSYLDFTFHRRKKQ